MARCEQIGCDDPGPWAWREPHTGDVHWVCRPCGDRLVATIGGMLDPVATSQPKRRAKKATSALVKAAGIEIKDYTARVEASELLDRARKRHEQLRFVIDYLEEELAK